MTMFGMSESLPDGYARVLLPTSPLGAVVPVCRRCGALIAPAEFATGSPTPIEAHDQFHASPQARAT